MKTLDFSAMENIQGGLGLSGLPIGGLLTLAIGLLNTVISTGVGALGSLETSLLSLATSLQGATGGLGL